MSRPEMEINISVSEINNFLGCRRMWDYSSSLGQGLRHKITPAVYLSVGSAFHAAIEANAKGLDPMEALDAYLEKERDAQVQQYTESTGGNPLGMETGKFNEAATLARQVTAQYFRKYGLENPLEDQGLTYAGVEVPFSIPMFTIPGTESFTGENIAVNFVGTIDGIATDTDTRSLVYLLENKALVRVPKDIELVRRSNQFVGYTWAYRELTGETPAGLLYNVAVKSAIQSPRVLKDGSLSQNKTARVTLESFMDAITTGNYNPEDYWEYISMLADRENAGDNRFFLRKKFSYSGHELDSWGATLKSIMLDMVQSPTVYPNFTHCDRCFFRDLCHAQETGGDLEQIKAAVYKQGTYGTMETVAKVRPEDIIRCDSPKNLVDGLSTTNTHGV